MKNTISTSIGGIVFNVEEDAHAKLSSYIDAISASLKDSEGHDEIMSDIESRIAEILQQKVSDYKQVITLAEVNEVIGIMGKPEDFGTTTANSNKQEDTYTNNQYRTSGRRRVYRDTDHKVVFGVCSGLAHHFDVDPIWLRLAFALCILFGGFGLPLYILLAIITPKARTAAEKLEMMGEPVDVNNIRKMMEEEFLHVKKKVSDFGSNVKASRGKDFGKSMGDFLSSFGNGLGKFAGGILKVVLIVLGSIAAFVLLLLLGGLIASVTGGVNITDTDTSTHQLIHYSFYDLLNMLSVTGAMRGIFVIGVFLFIGVPLLALIVRVIRAAMGRKEPFHWFTITASVLWAAGLVFMFVGITAVFSHFSVTDFSRKDVTLNVPSSKTLYVKMDNAGTEEKGITLGTSDSLNIYISGADGFSESPVLCIEQSPDSNYHLSITKIARGITRADADNYIDGIDYTYTTHDSTLVLDPYFRFELDKGWRKQKLDMTIEVPLNKNINLPDGIDNILCSSLHHKGHHVSGGKWTMTQMGLVPYSSGTN